MTRNSDLDTFSKDLARFRGPSLLADDFVPVRRLRQTMTDLDKEFDSLLKSFGFSDVRGVPRPRLAPAVDVHDTGSSYEFTIEVPGMDAEDIEVSIDDNKLIVAGEKKKASKEEQDGSIREERVYGRFHREFDLPNTINAEGIEASYDRGILTIQVPKVEVEKQKKTVKVLMKDQKSIREAQEDEQENANPP